MRTFLAVDVPPPEAEGFRFASPTSHITLRFLGERTPAESDQIAKVVGPAVRPLPPFRCVLRGAGAFPNVERPRVAWVGVAEGATELIDLERVVSSALGTVGIAAEPRPYFPHLTLFRVRGRSDAGRVRRLVDELRDRTMGTAEIREVLLKESRLTPQRAEHRTLAAFPLAGTPPGPA
jgi:2'-5' RNA ligase